MKENEFDQKILFGCEYKPDRNDDPIFNRNLLDNLQSILEPERIKTEDKINQILNECKEKYNLQQIVVKNINGREEVRFLVDLDKIKT
jgi:hypothetical protein